jgi:hypothetical protein
MNKWQLSTNDKYYDKKVECCNRDWITKGNLDCVVMNGLNKWCMIQSDIQTPIVIASQAEGTMSTMLLFENELLMVLNWKKTNVARL